MLWYYKYTQTNLFDSQKSEQSRKFEEKKTDILKISKFLKKNSKSEKFRTFWKKIWKSEKCIDIFEKKSKIGNRTFFSPKSKFLLVCVFHRYKYFIQDFEKKYFEHPFMSIFHFCDLRFASIFSNFLQIFRFPNLFLDFCLSFQYFCYAQKIQLWGTQLSLFLDFQTDFWLLRNSTFTITYTMLYIHGR